MSTSGLTVAGTDAGCSFVFLEVPLFRDRVLWRQLYSEQAGIVGKRIGAHARVSPGAHSQTCPPSEAARWSAWAISLVLMTILVRVKMIS